MKNGAPFTNVLPFLQHTEEAAVPEKPFELPDFEARMKRIWGDRVFTEAEVQEMRDAEDGIIE